MDASPNEALNQLNRAAAEADGAAAHSPVPAGSTSGSAQRRKRAGSARANVTFTHDVIARDEEGQGADSAAASARALFGEGGEIGGAGDESGEPGAGGGGGYGRGRASQLGDDAGGPDGGFLSTPPRHPRVSRAARARALVATSGGAGVGVGDSYLMYGTADERPRATSGSEVGLELDPGTAKVIEVYGFVGWISTFVAWAGYLLWAYLPEAVLHQVRGFALMRERAAVMALPKRWTHANRFDSSASPYPRLLAASAGWRYVLPEQVLGAGCACSPGAGGVFLHIYLRGYWPLRKPALGCL
jgi:hypothetical protein